MSHPRRQGQPHKGWKAAAKSSRREQQAAEVVDDPRREWLPNAGTSYQIKPVFDVDNPEGEHS